MGKPGLPASDSARSCSSVAPVRHRKKKYIGAIPGQEAISCKTEDIRVVLEYAAPGRHIVMPWEESVKTKTRAFASPGKKPD